MFKRHFTRLISILLMVLVSVGFTAGIGMATDKINDSIAEYHEARNVSDMILLNDEGSFTDDDIAALETQFGAENVQTGGMLEFEVKDGKATVNDTELTFTNVPDGIVRVYLFDENAPPNSLKGMTRRRRLLSRRPLHTERCLSTLLRTMFSAERYAIRCTWRCATTRVIPTTPPPTTRTICSI